MDGRVHFTGRGGIHHATKPLPGLTNNLPLFSRAGDETLASMVMLEFRVANQGRQDSFSVRKRDHGWMASLEQWPEIITPLTLREGLLRFFVDFVHKPNPWRIRQKSLGESARRGLAVFRDRCSDCHQPLESASADTGVEFEQWEQWLTGDHRDLIWGAPFLARTGLKPYAAAAGVRVPSLRRVWTKYPLFTSTPKSRLFVFA